jgi:hypothetical protein
MASAKPAVSAESADERALRAPVDSWDDIAVRLALTGRATLSTRLERHLNRHIAVKRERPAIAFGVGGGAVYRRTDFVVGETRDWLASLEAAHPETPLMYDDMAGVWYPHLLLWGWQPPRAVQQHTITDDSRRKHRPAADAANVAESPSSHPSMPNSIKDAVQDFLSDHLCERGLCRLVWQYAKVLTTILFNSRAGIILATAGDGEWITTTNEFFAVGSASVAAVWHDGQCYHQVASHLWSTADPLGGRWTARTSLDGLLVTYKPELLASVDGILYGLCGISHNSVCRYDPTSREWVVAVGCEDVNLNTRFRHCVGHVVIGQCVYIVGGSSLADWPYCVTRLQLGGPTTTPADQRLTHWRRVLHRMRTYCCALVRDGCIYIAGGPNEGTVECFDLQTYTSELLPPMQCDRWGPSMALSDDGAELYVIGGASPGSRTPHAPCSIEAYNFGNKTWRVLPVTIPHIEDALAVHPV